MISMYVSSQSFSQAKGNTWFNYYSITLSPISFQMHNVDAFYSIIACSHASAKK